MSTFTGTDLDPHGPGFPHGPDCFGCKCRSVQMNTGVAQPTNIADRRLSADLAAYKRLRREGLQPPHVDGSAELECQAQEKIEVERATIFSKPIRQEILAKTAELAGT